MAASSVLMLVIIAGFIWGGFLLVLIVALRKEGQKTRERERPGGSPTGGRGLPPRA